MTKEKLTAIGMTEIALEKFEELRQAIYEMEFEYAIPHELIDSLNESFEKSHETKKKLLEIKKTLLTELLNPSK
jgi:signal recognition particle GTPase